MKLFIPSIKPIDEMPSRRHPTRLELVKWMIPKFEGKVHSDDIRVYLSFIGFTGFYPIPMLNISYSPDKVVWWSNVEANWKLKGNHQLVMYIHGGDWLLGHRRHDFNLDHEHTLNVSYTIRT